MNPNSVLIGMSGGVDSTVAAIKLRNAGMEVQGVHLMLWKWQQDARQFQQEIQKMDALSKKIEIPIVYYDAKDEFHQIIVQDMQEKLRMGLTPNPCVRCNPNIKFKLLNKLSRQYRIQYISTGHYGKVQKKSDGSYAIYKARDLSKDQSYFLCYLNQDILQKIIFPLGNTTKSENMDFALRMGLNVVNERESQDLCFLAENKYLDFLKGIGKDLINTGKIVDSQGNDLGEHQGLAFYTVGQRKGIRISAKEPYYVIKKDIDKNLLVIGHKDEIGFDQMKVKDVNWIHGHPVYSLDCLVKIRYRSREYPVVVKKMDDDSYLVKFRTKIRDLTPGQYAVFYEKDEMIGGGEIFEVY